jgi:hypothetical protein
MPDRVILTEKREELLTGRYDGSDAARRNQKSRLRKSAQTALEELTMIAQSPHIDHSEVFDPDDVFQLLRALLAPDQEHLEAGDLTNDDFTHIVTRDKYTDEFAAYSDRLQLQMSKLILEKDLD